MTLNSLSMRALEDSPRMNGGVMRRRDPIALALAALAEAPLRICAASRKAAYDG